MIKRLQWLFGLVISFYLLIPGPKLPPPNLPNGLKSTEPGDTTQISRVSAYYTNKQRDEILDFYTSYYSRSRLFNLPLPGFRLNHPPEYARQIWVNTKQSYYLEEIVHPLRESLFVNGFEWEKDVFTPVYARAQNKMLANGKEWPAKVSLRWFPSFWLTRLSIFWLSWLGLFFLLSAWRKELRND